MPTAVERRSRSCARNPSSADVQLAVAATAPFGADVLERLAEHHELAYVLTRPDRPRGRGRRPGAPPAKEVTDRLGFPVRQPERLDGSFDPAADVVVVVAYGALIPESLLERALWLNVHPSMLPRWRGAAPVERAIMAGDATTGVTIHRTTAELDAGPVAAQRAFPIDDEDDAGSVYTKAAPIAVELLDEVLAGQPTFTPQARDGATYAEKITAADRWIDWSRSPREIVNQVRALSPHIGARAELDGRQVIVWRARIEGGRAVPIEVQAEGRRRMSYEEFLRGLR
jgi:methionyl-tRNA formyltransferase